MSFTKQATKEQVENQDLRTLGMLVGAGAMTGAGAGLITSLVNYHNYLKQKREDSEALKEDTSYAPMVPVEIKSAEEKTMGPSLPYMGLGLAGGGFAGILSYNMVRKLYQDMKIKEMEKTLENSEEAYANALASERDAFINKNANDDVNRGYTNMEVLSALLLSMVPVAAIGSGVLTHKLLDKAFPKTKTTGDPGMRPVRISMPPPPLQQKVNEEEDEKELNKLASDPDCLYAAAKIARSMAMNAGVNSTLTSLDKIASEERFQEFKALLYDFGIDAAMAGIKSASDVSDGISYMVDDPYCKPVLEMLTATEMLDLAPAHVAIYKHASTGDKLFALGHLKMAGVLFKTLKAKGDDGLMAAMADADNKIKGTHEKSESSGSMDYLRSIRSMNTGEEKSIEPDESNIFKPKSDDLKSDSGDIITKALE